MTENEAFLDACKGVVMNCECNVLVLEIMGEYRAFLANSFRIKNREILHSEVLEAQDITILIKNLGSNFAHGMTQQTLLEKTQFIPKEDFKFGTDNFYWFNRVKINSEERRIYR